MTDKMLLHFTCNLNYLKVGIENLVSHGTVRLVLGIINRFGLHHLVVDGLQAQDVVDLQKSKNERHSPEVKNVVGGP